MSLKALSAEERDDLRDIEGSMGMEALRKLMAAHLGCMAKDVLTCDLTANTEKDLMFRKLRHEGAAKLVRDMETSLASLKAKKE